MPSDYVTRTTHHSYGSRLMNSVFGVLIGVLLVALSVVLLFWNEGRAVTTAKSLDETQAQLVSVAADQLDFTNSGKPVHVTGEAVSDATLSDETFGITETAVLKLHRVVEMYQWKERSETRTVKNGDGSEDRTTTYYYDTVWSSSRIDSSRFEERYNHRNPPAMPYDGRERIASPINVGSFTLSSTLVGKIDIAEARPISREEFASLGAGVQEAAGGRPLTLRSGVLYGAHTPEAPQVGDFRVKFQVVRPQTVSIVARQEGASLVPHPTEAGGEIALLQPGYHDGQSMIAAAHTKNTLWTWGLRAIGFVLMLVGFNLMLKPFAVAGDIVPILGDVVAAGVGLAAGAVALGLSFATIATAWFFYRPALAILLLTGGVLALYGARRLGARN